MTRRKRASNEIAQMERTKYAIPPLDAQKSQLDCFPHTSTPCLWFLCK